MKFSWDKGTSPKLPRVVISAPGDDFDPQSIRKWEDEGFRVSYLPYSGTRKDFEVAIKKLPDPLDLGEKYALVAYDDAASVILNVAEKPMPKLCALVAYYPGKVPNPSVGFPSSTRVMVHFAKPPDFVPRYRNYTYPDVQPGFAEADMDEYDVVASGLAWSRSLGAVRKGFDMDPDLESPWDKYLAQQTKTKHASVLLETMTDKPQLINFPTLTGGTGREQLQKFYQHYFLNRNPPSLRLKLISRTVGTDHVVDEMHVSFKHTLEMPWILPNIKPTNKAVQIPLVTVVRFQGGKIANEHLYWDQASVLAQMGLLNAADSAGKNHRRLPIVGADQARKLLDDASVPSNKLP